MFLFFTNEKRIRHNLKCLAEACGKTYPVAILRTHSIGPVGGIAVKSHFDFKSKVPDTSIICVDAKVAIENRNFCPIWGLHNGACGIAREIVLGKGYSPHTGDFPLYVVVEFPQYCGPPWDMSNPTVSLQPIENSPVYHSGLTQSYTPLQFVPIPSSKFGYKSSCFSRTYIPLSLAYARTIHKFQGLSAGPVDEGKIPNMFDVIVCDPDES